MLTRKNLGQAVRAVRLKKGYTQKELSEKLANSKSNSYMSLIESGKRFTTIETIDDLCASLEIKPYELIYIACNIHDPNKLYDTRTVDIRKHI